MASTMNLIDNIMTEQASLAEGIVREAWIRTLADREQSEMLVAQKWLDYFNKNRDEIVKYCAITAEKTFDDVSDWQWPPINFVARTIKRLSLAFRNPPAFQFVDAKGDAIDDSAGKLNALVWNVLFAKMDVIDKLKSIDNYSKLMNTILVEPVWRNGGIDWDIHMRPSTVVIPDPANYLTFKKVASKWSFINPDDLRARDGWIYWSDDQHEFIDATGRAYGMSTPDGSNPYETIPMTVVRTIEQDVFWGRFGGDLVDANESTMIQLGNIWEIMIFQSFGQPIGTNLQLNSGDTLRLGPKHPIIAEKVTSDMVPPSLQFVKPDADIAVVMDGIDRYIKWIAASFSLPPSAWSLDEQRQSGFAKFMDNIENLENRDDDIPSWKRTISELFNHSRMVHNYWCGKAGIESIPEDFFIDAIFPDASFPESPTEKIERYTVAIGAGLSSPVRYYMDEYDMDEQAAIEAATKDAKWNKMIATAAMPELPELPGSENVPRETEPKGTE